MGLQRTVTGLVLGLLAVSAASAQADGALRWRGGQPALGLHPGQAEWRVPCGSFAFPCDAGVASLPLYASSAATRSLSMQVGSLGADGAGRVPRPQGLNVSLLGQAGLGAGLGVYGRVGGIFATVGTAAPAAPASPDAGVSWGVGFSWDFSRHGSAVLGWESYDFRSAVGEPRDVQATSLGLRWRY